MQAPAASSFAAERPLAKQPSADNDSRVTSEGFEARAQAATLFMDVPLEGTFGEDVSHDGVYNAMRAAVADPYIEHVVFTIDSSQGNLLGEETFNEFIEDIVVHAIVKDATGPAIFPAFYSQNIFMVDDGQIGGLPLHRFVPQGSEEVIAKMVGIFSSQLASAASFNGHNPDIVRAMIDTTKELHYWEEDGQVVVSNAAPRSMGDVENYFRVGSDFASDTIVLNAQQAIKLELARPIIGYDALWVGDELGDEDWTRANRFGVVVEEFGLLFTQLREAQEGLEAFEAQQQDVRNNSDNRNDPMVRQQQEFKRNLERAASGAEQIADAFEQLFDHHPERQTYFLGEDGRTILADPDQWREDVQFAKNMIRQARTGYNIMRSSFTALQADPDRLSEIGEKIDIISEHIDGISEHGNADYWENHYVKPYPPDEYGVTYG